MEYTSMKPIPKHACPQCPAVANQRAGIVEDEDVYIKQFPKSFIATEFLYSCFKRTQYLCKGNCDDMEIDQAFLDSLPITKMKRDLPFVAKGPLSVALGVSQETGQRCEDVINELIFEKKATLEQVVTHVNE